jgi:hypothetical protein
MNFIELGVQAPALEARLRCSLQRILGQASPDKRKSMIKKEMLFCPPVLHCSVRLLHDATLW